MAPSNCYKSNIISQHSGERTGEVIYETTDGRFFKHADPWDIMHKPTGAEFYTKCGNTVSKGCGYASSDD